MKQLVIAFVLVLSPAVISRSNIAADEIMAQAVLQTENDASFLATRYSTSANLTVLNLENGSLETSDSLPAKEKPQLTLADLFNHKRYDYSQPLLETLDGTPAYRIDFQPKLGRPEDAKLLGKVLDALEGTVWVQRKNSGIIQVKARLTHPVKKWPVEIKTLTAFFQQETLAGAWVPQSVQAQTEYSAFWGLIHRHQERTYTFTYIPK